jgi:hypothetical protein
MINKMALGNLQYQRKRQFTKVNLKKARSKAGEFSHGLMDRALKANGKMEKLAGLDATIGVMVESTLANGWSRSSVA